MPRRSSRLRRFLTGAGSAGLATASSGNPYVIGGAAIVGGTLNALRDDPQFDPAPYRQAFRKAEAVALRRSDRRSREIGSQLGTDFNRRGISGGLREGVIQGNRRVSEQETLDTLALREADLELEIANAEQGVQNQISTDFNSELVALASQGSTLAQRVLNPQPFQNDPPAIRNIRDRLGIPNPEQIDYSQFFDIGGNQVPKESGLGVLFSASQDYVRQLAENYAGGLEGLMQLLGRAQQNAR